MPNHPRTPPSATCRFPRTSEENLSRSKSTTKVTGFVSVALQGCFLILGILSTGPIVVDLSAVLAGFRISSGSQAWLRYRCFAAGFLALSGWLRCLPTLLLDAPLKPFFGTSETWLLRSDPDFWLTTMAYTLGFSIEAALCIRCLRSRRLVFWTRRSRIWGRITIAIASVWLLIGSAQNLIRSIKDRAAKDRLHKEIDAVRSRIQGDIDEASMLSILHQNPEIRAVSWRYLSGGHSMIYHRERAEPDQEPDLRIHIKEPTPGFVEFILGQ